MGFNTIDDYIAGFPYEIRELLSQMRELIKENAPDATEKISYAMPTFYLSGNLVHFAGYAKHIGFYPTPSAISAFEAELKQYVYAKGSVQFPVNQPLPVELIARMVKFRVQEVLQKPTKVKRKK